jgi:hypothetical protein
MAAPKPQTPEEKEADGADTTLPLKAAADLIQTLDMAYSEMTHCAADAAKDADVARRNARAASEIARRYLHRSYPKVQSLSPFGAKPPTSAPSPKNTTTTATSTMTRDHSETKEDPLHEINDLVSDLQTPRQEDSRFTFSPSPSRPGTNSRTRRTYQTPSSTERIAQSHANDVLALSMELERTKQSLKSEQRMHEDTKASLASYKFKTKSLEEQNEKILNDLESQRQASEEATSDGDEDLAKAKLRLQAAEEDAQLALDLAKESAEKRDQMEDVLQQALEELRILKEHKSTTPQTTPKRSVRFADDTAEAAIVPLPEEVVLTTREEAAAPRSSPSRSMVAAGRQLLRRSKASPNEEVITLELTPAKSAERRRRLRERLTQLDEELPPSPCKSPQRRGSGSHKKTLDECHNTAKLVQGSGQRLELGGHWFRKGQPLSPEIHLEAMTRQYCQSTEVRLLLLVHACLSACLHTQSYNIMCLLGNAHNSFMFVYHYSTVQNRQATKRTQRTRIALRISGKEIGHWQQLDDDKGIQYIISAPCCF